MIANVIRYLECFVHEGLRAFGEPPAGHKHEIDNGRKRCKACCHRVGDGVIATRQQPWRCFAEVHGRAMMRYLYAS